MDAVAEIQMFASRSYEWLFQGDIKACFDEIDHTALMDHVRRRIGDRRVLGLVKSFLKAGILGEDRVHRESNTGTPQGGIFSPLLANIALEVIEEHFARLWEDTFSSRVDRSPRRRHGLPVFRLVRYADDFVVLVSGTKEHAEALRQQVADALTSVGLRLSEEETHLSISTRGSTSSGSASSGTGSRAPTTGTSSPSPPERPSRRSGRK